MTKSLRFVLLGFAIVGVAGAPALANEAKPATGFVFNLKRGETAQVLIGGTQSCKFDVMTTVDNAQVASVEPTANQQTSHKMLISADGVGSTMITFMTANGTIAQCQGFTFSYTINVEANPEGAIAQAKSKMSEELKVISSIAKGIAADYKADLAEILTARKLGTITTQKAIDNALDLSADAINDLYDEICDELDDFDDDLDDRLTQFGIDDLNFPMTLTLGGCGIYDAFIDKVDATYFKTQDGMHATVKKFIKSLNTADIQAGGDGVKILVPPVRAVLAENLVVNRVTDPAPPAKPAIPLRILWAASGRQSADLNSNLVVGGAADPGLGDVTVRYDGPDGTTAQVSATVSPDGTWKANFSALPPGPYVITVSKGNDGPVTRTHRIL